MVIILLVSDEADNTPALRCLHNLCQRLCQSYCAHAAWSTVGQYTFSVFFFTTPHLIGWWKNGQCLHHLCHPGFLWSQRSAVWGVAHRRPLIRVWLHSDRRISLEAQKHTTDTVWTTKQPFVAVDATVTSVSSWQNVTRVWILHHSTPELFSCSFFSGLMPAGSDFLRCFHCPFSKHAHATSAWPRRLYLQNIWHALAVPLMWPCLILSVLVRSQRSATFWSLRALCHQTSPELSASIPLDKPGEQ